jgi:hypothetical protein
VNDHPAVKLDDLEEAMLFVGANGGFGAAAWLCRESGAVVWHSDDTDEFAPLPTDIDDIERYVAVPDQQELGLGKPLALEFTRMQLPACYEQVCAIFAHRGAYARFKDLLDRQQRLDAWHQWETTRTRQALRAWCAAKGIELAD